MVEYNISLKSVDDAKELVRLATQCDFDVDLSYQRAIVDAKSILGVISLGFTHILKVSCQKHDREFVGNIQRFVVE